MVLLRNDPPGREEEKKEVTQRILSLTLEIVHLLTGEDYTVVKKTSGDCATPNSHLHESGGWSSSQSPITQPPPHLPIQGQKILDLTNKIIELLTGEVPIRCQDVAVYFSMEEWEYLGGHEDLYKDIMKENQQPFISHENPSGNSNGDLMLLSNYKVEDEDFVQYSSGENLITINVYPELYSTDQSYNLPNYKETSDEFLNFIISTDHEEAKIFHCGECGKQFTKSSNLAKHRRIHTGEKPYSCSECGKRFPEKSKLVTHKRTHTGEKPHSCSGCGKCFAYKSSLERHERIHTGEMPFSCSECGKSFKCKSTLIRHERIHTGEKPFPCSECGKCFADKTHLVRHERSHTGEKPFPCSECGKRFAYKSDLVTHVRIHTGEKPFSCSECGKCFADKSNLILHERIHTGEKPYSCSECGKRFASNAKRRDHQRRHTAEKTF